MRVFSYLWVTFTLIIYCYLIPTWLASTAIHYLVFVSIRDMQALAFAASTVLYPIVLIFMEYLAWKSIANHRYTHAVIFASIPSILIVFIWGYLYDFNLQFWWPWKE